VAHIASGAGAHREPGQTGNFVFLSHSHRDIIQVRQVRDDLEAEGHFPLMFFLKCLGDESEVDSLIRREIEARDWFLLCDSPHARKSRWVQSELEHIASFPGKYCTRVELDADSETRAAQVHDLSKRMTVFLSYAAADSGVASSIGAQLRDQGYRVFPNDRQLEVGENWGTTVDLQLDAAVRQGFVLPLLTPESVSPGSFLREELAAAIRRRAPGARNIIPLMIEPCSAPLPIATIQWLDWTQGDRESNLVKLVHLLKTIEMG